MQGVGCFCCQHAQGSVEICLGRNGDQRPAIKQEQPHSAREAGVHVPHGMAETGSMAGNCRGLHPTPERDRRKTLLQLSLSSCQQLGWVGGREEGTASSKTASNESIHAHTHPHASRPVWLRHAMRPGRERSRIFPTPSPSTSASPRAQKPESGLEHPEAFLSPVP